MTLSAQRHLRDLRAAAVGAVVLWAPTFGCGTNDPPRPTTTRCDDVALVVAASDRQGSSVVCGAPGCELNERTTGADLGSDPTLATSPGRAFFFARDKDLLFELDAACGTPTSKIALHDFGPLVAGARRLANPHDVAAGPDGTLFVTLFNTGALGIIKDGAREGTIDLTSYDDDGNPNPESIRIVEVDGKPKAFVVLEMLDNQALMLPPKRGARMVRVDVERRAVEHATDLIGWNPFNTMAESDGYLYLAVPRSFNAKDEEFAGIERFDPRSETSVLLVPETALGGSVVEVAVDGACGVAIVAGPEPTVNPTWVITFDAKTGEVLSGATPLVAAAGYDLYGLAFRDDKLYVGDRRATSGGYPIHVFSRTADACIFSAFGAPILIPQKPVALRAARPRP